MKQSFESRLCDLILSGHALIQVRTPERYRFVQFLQGMLKSLGDDFTIEEWCIAYGWDVAKLRSEAVSIPEDQGKPENVPNEVLSRPEHTLCVLYDFGMYLDTKKFQFADVVSSALVHLRPVYAASSRWILFVGDDMEIPKVLEHEIVTIDFELPSDDEIATRVDNLCADHAAKHIAVEEERSNIIAACRGMTDQQIEDRLLLSIRTCKKLGRESVELLLREKADIIRQTGLLTYRDPPEGGLERLGGWENVKQQVISDGKCLHTDAQEYGIPYPKGLLFVGISGCGKTAMSLAISSYLHLPLIQMDVGSLMSKWVGESEQNMRNAIRMLERISPCVLQVDEIEKGFSGVNSEDGGASVRTFGTFLKWLNDRTCPVYFIATANQVESLPPELLRKGRIDEVYGISLPTAEERAQILGIHLGLLGLGHVFDNTDLFDVSKTLAGYTGSDIQQVAIMALKYLWNHGIDKQKVSKQMLSDFLEKSIRRVLPFSKTNPDSVKKITAWLNEHTRPAGIPDENSTLKRRVTMKGEN